MLPNAHRTYSPRQLLVPIVLCVVIALFLGVAILALVRAQLDAARLELSMMNLKNLGHAVHNYASTYDGKLPPGVDDKHFSALFHLLPFIGQENLYHSADRTKDSADEANAKVRSTRVKAFESPLDPVNDKAPAGGTNYFAMTGILMSINDNDGIFCRNRGEWLKMGNIPTGTSNTVLFVEMLRGDGGKKAVSVQRQHVRLEAGDLKTLKDTDGVKDFADGKNIAADRGSAWIDGRFLQSTTNATRGMLDEKPDVDCGGEGGLAGVRMVGDGTHVCMADGSVRWISAKMDLVAWQEICTTVLKIGDVDW